MEKTKTKKTKLVKLVDEEWREIPGSEGIYFISNYGRIKSYRRDRKDGRIMKLTTVKGFYCTNLKLYGKYKSYLVHKLTAQVFLEKSSPLHERVCHIDWNIRNNHISNLAWITKVENYARVMKHLNDINRSKPGKFAPFTKLKTDDVRQIKIMLQRGIKQKMIAKLFAVSEMQITRIKKGVNWAEVVVEDK